MHTGRRMGASSPSRGGGGGATTSTTQSTRLSVRSFRELLKVASEVSTQCGLASEGGLERYLSQRFRVVAERNRLQNIPPNQVRIHAAMVGRYCDALRLAPGNVALTSMLRAMSAGVGSSTYQRMLEKGFVNYVSFEAQREDRGVVDDEMTAERQNRMLQAGVLPYIERLCLLHEFSGDASLLRNAFGGTKAGTTVHVFSSGDEEVVTEIDEELNKQTIYIKCPEYIWPAVKAKNNEHSSNSVDGEDDVVDESDGVIEDVEVCEADSIRGTVLHADWNATATRIYDSLLESAPVHRSRHTVVIGHGVGGAVSLVVAMMLETEGFAVKNTVAFGSPRVIQDTPMSVVRSINPIRVMRSGDPQVEVPTTTSERQSFIHIGESLLVDSDKMMKDYSVQGYTAALRDMRANLLYSEGDDDLGGSRRTKSGADGGRDGGTLHGTSNASFSR